MRDIYAVVEAMEARRMMSVTALSAATETRADREPGSIHVSEVVVTKSTDCAGPGDEGPEETITFVYGKLG